MEIVNEYKKYLLEADKSNNTINAYVTDISKTDELIKNNR